MEKDRLSYLALFHIHYDLPVDLDKVSIVDGFTRCHPRRPELTHFPNLTLLFYWSMQLFVECASY